MKTNINSCVTQKPNVVSQENKFDLAFIMQCTQTN